MGFGRKKGERTLQREKSEDLEGKRWRWVQNPFMVLSHNQNREIETMLVLRISRYIVLSTIHVLFHLRLITHEVDPLIFLTLQMRNCGVSRGKLLTICHIGHCSAKLEVK